MGRDRPASDSPDGDGQGFSGALPANVDYDAMCGCKRVMPSVITAKGIDLETFAGALAQQPDVRRVVRHRAPLEGEFDVELEYARFTGAGDPAQGPGLTTAPDA